MGKKFIVERETNVREEPETSVLGLIFGGLFWFFILGCIARGCGG